MPNMTTNVSTVTATFLRAFTCKIEEKYEMYINGLVEILLIHPKHRDRSAAMRRITTFYRIYQRHCEPYYSTVTLFNSTITKFNYQM